ncbi:hypothetical protein OG819_42645 [Streptomyces sp. NBC_01549]|uniref:hypothetical protein n=1 Tax=Streptomyces sp. NBC_01549 TaxID=2975874 RepID=UPI00225C3334|nr:hypothetical protein [Streptomyces sp. NBC_01549]MCX4596116.1 hypothetical protein [Streptomyces sp. NBC_01549]
MPFHPGQRVRTTVDDSRAPAGSPGTVIHPLDKWGDYGVLVDDGKSEVMRAYGEDELALIADIPD